MERSRVRRTFEERKGDAAGGEEEPAWRFSEHCDEENYHLWQVLTDDHV